jgi:hypothetical protein
MQLRLDRKVGLVAFAVVAVQLPFVWSAGVGQDPDAWRLLLAGEIYADSGRYTMSRPPGYPAVELVARALAGAPMWVYTGLTAAVTTVAVVAFADLIRTLQVRAWVPLTIGFALTPVIYRNSVSFMDYNWSLAFLLLSWAALARSRPVVVGLMFGLAVASRPSTAAAVVVILVVLWGQREPLHAWVKILGTSGLVATAFFVAPLTLFGLGFLNAVPAIAAPAVIAGRASVGVWGTFGSIGVAAAVAVIGYRLVRQRLVVLPGTTPWAIAAGVGLVTQTGLFLLLPADAGYLSSAVPLVWLLAGVAFTPAVAIALAIAVSASSFLAPTASDIFGTTILKDRAERHETSEYLRRISQRIDELPAGTVVFAGYHMPQLLALRPTAVATSRSADSSFRPGLGNRFVLPDGQILVDQLTDSDRGAKSIYQLPVADGDYPVLQPAD